MRLLQLLIIMLMCTGVAQAQTIDELKTMMADKSAMAGDLQAKADAAAADAAGLQDQIDKLSGWRKGLGGIFGFDWSNATEWAGGSENPLVAAGSTSSQSLAADISGYLLRDTDKTFWHNKLKIVEAYKDLDLLGSTEDDNLFDNAITDYLQISSLGGYKITDKLAISAQGEIQTSLLNNFFNPATVDLGLGITWLPIENMTVMIHPFNWNTIIRSGDLIEGTSSVGAKVRVDYFRDFTISGKAFHWDTNLTAFVPYSTADDELGNQYWQWLNNVTFEVWKGIGVGVGWGLRAADQESLDLVSGDPELQSYTTLGLSYRL